MNTYIKTLLVCFVLTWISCDKNEPGKKIPTKEETARDIFYKIPGLYQVSDSAGNYEYTMSVKYFPDTIFENGIFLTTRDCVGVFNFDNQFDSLYFYYNSLNLSSISKRPVIFAGFYIENATKSNGSRWKVIDHFPNDLDDGDKLGWNNGEMWMSFRLININYYMDDGVPFGDTLKFQKAVRIGD
jgi:hypothetical protein